MSSRRSSDGIRLGVRALAPALVALGVLGLGAAGRGCAIYDAELVGPAIPQVGGLGFWSGLADRDCYSARRPRPAGRPAPSDAPNEPIFHLALSNLRLGGLDTDGRTSADAWKDIGYDVDGLCTASETCAASQSAPSSACRAPNGATNLDGNYCRDNAFGELSARTAVVPDVVRGYGLSEDGFNCALCAGHYNFLLRVTGYNGTGNDAQMRLDFYPSLGLEEALPWDCADPTWRERPCFRPDMPWIVQRDVFAESRVGDELPPSKIFDDDAFVRDGVFVAQLPSDVLFWFPGNRSLAVAFPLRIRGGLVSGRLDKGPDGLWRIQDGLIGGRTTRDDVIQGLRLVGLCETDANYELVLGYLREAVDLRADGRIAPDEECDALSLGIAFGARQATPGRDEVAPTLTECVPRGGLGGGGADGGP